MAEEEKPRSELPELDEFVGEMAIPMTAGSAAIVIERLRTIYVEGYTPEHDAEHPISALLDAARAYMHSAEPRFQRAALEWWPWEDEKFKPRAPIEDLTRAGALIAAALDKLLLEQDEK